MTVFSGQPVYASDFNLLAGQTTTPAINGPAAFKKAGHLWGVGYGDRGYGRTTPALTVKNTGENIGQEWKDLRNTIFNLAQWQASSVSLPSAANFEIGYPPNAVDVNALETALAIVDSNRFNYQLSNMTLTSGASSTRATNWGTGSESISATFQISFTSEDQARFFFNTGGEIRLSFDHPSTLTPRDLSWATLLSSLVIKFTASNTTRISGPGINTSVGYYSLSTSFQTIIDGSNVGTGAYTTNDYLVEARTTSIVGSNGGRGNELQIRVTFIDQQTNSFSDIVQAGTTANISHLRATTGIIVDAPIISVISNF